MIIFQLSVFVSIPILTEWVDFFDFMVLDSALCNREVRGRYIEYVKTFNNHFEEYMNKSRNYCDLSLSLLQWCAARRLRLRNVTITNHILFLDGLDRVLFESHASLIQSARILRPSEINGLPAILDALTDLQELAIHRFKDQLYETPLQKIVECLTGRCPVLRRLQFVDCFATSQTPFLAMLRSHPGLTYLQLPGCSNWNRDFFACLTVSMRSLTSLTVPYSTPESHMISFLMHPLPLLKECNLPCLRQLQLHLFLGNFGHRLETIDLSSHAINVTDDVVLALACTCRMVTSLNLTYCVYITSNALVEALGPLSLLRKIFIDYTKLGVASVIHRIAECYSELEVLKIGTNKVTVTPALHLKCLTRCTALHTLSLISVGLTDAMLVALLRYCPRLTSLDVTENSLLITSYSCEEVVPLMTRLQNLVLDRCYNVHYSFLPLLAVHCRDLRWLSLSDCRQTRLSGVEAVLTTNKRLSTLNLSGCVFPAAGSFRHIAAACRATSITALDFTKCNIQSDDVIFLVESLPKLREFSFSCSAVTASSLLAINPDLQF